MFLVLHTKPLLILHWKRHSTFALTRVLLCTCVAGYYIGMCFAAPEQNLLYIHHASQGWQIYLTVSLAIQLVSCALAFYWSRQGWVNHPICKALSVHAPPNSSWRAVASSINTEFRRIDKFASGSPSARVIVTDTWVLKVTTYHLHVALHQDCHLTVTDSKHHSLSPDLNTPVQIVTITVASINPRVKSFDIRSFHIYLYVFVCLIS